MSRWEALYWLLEAAISERGRTARLVVIILVMTVAIAFLGIVFLPTVHAELARYLWRVIHVVGQHPPLG